VLEYPKADLERTPYSVSWRTHCLELKKNLYGQRQAGRACNEYPQEGLSASRGAIQSRLEDLCLCYRGRVAGTIYNGTGIIIGHTDHRDIKDTCASLAKPVKWQRVFNVTNEAD
jgi:hypothetical protein